jgi:hypothetical protein
MLLECNKASMSSVNKIMKNVYTNLIIVYQDVNFLWFQFMTIAYMYHEITENLPLVKYEYWRFHNYNSFKIFS